MGITHGIDRAWNALRADLERNADDLCEAVRRYPQPIARCDAQLPGAIAERDAALRVLRDAEQIEAARRLLGPQQWRSRVLEFAASLGAGGDAPLAIAVERLLHALGEEPR